MRSRLDAVGTTVVVLAAIVVAGANVYRALASDSRNTVAAAEPVTFVRDWRDLTKHGIWEGDSTAAVTVVDFSDLQCPFCRRFHQALTEVQTEFGSRIARVVIHYPLTNHAFALSAAIAAECADKSARFHEFIDRVFAKQDSIGSKSWASYAVEAGIGDTLSFSSCASSTEIPGRVEQGLGAGSKVGVRGTPTVIINGWRFARPPHDSLRQVVARILAGERPFQE